MSSKPSRHDDDAKAKRAETSIAVASLISVIAGAVVLYGFFDSLSNGQGWGFTVWFAVAVIAAVALPWLLARSGAKQAESKGRTRAVGQVLGRKDGAWTGAWILIFAVFGVCSMNLSEGLGRLP